MAGLSTAQSIKAAVPEEFVGLFDTYRGLTHNEIANAVLTAYNAKDLAGVVSGISSAISSAIGSAAQLVNDRSRSAENKTYAPGQIAKELLLRLERKTPQDRDLSQYKGVCGECDSLAKQAETLFATSMDSQESIERACGHIVSCVQASFRAVCELANSRSVPAHSQALYHLARSILISPNFTELVRTNATA